jgi:hypothetical protein
VAANSPQAVLAQHPLVFWPLGKPSERDSALVLQLGTTQTGADSHVAVAPGYRASFGASLPALI